jgi:hypothetical protein
MEGFVEIWFSDAPPNSLKDSNANSKMKIMKEKGVGVCFLIHNTSGVKRMSGTPKWGLRQVTSESIIHIDLHKPNNKLVSA